jgi:hypothetical protein
MRFEVVKAQKIFRKIQKIFLERCGMISYHRLFKLKSRTRIFARHVLPVIVLPAMIAGWTRQIDAHYASVGVHLTGKILSAKKLAE